jgi:hypothetical protein
LTLSLLFSANEMSSNVPPVLPSPSAALKSTPVSVLPREDSKSPNGCSTSFAYVQTGSCGGRPRRCVSIWYVGAMMLRICGSAATSSRVRLMPLLARYSACRRSRWTSASA